MWIGLINHAALFAPEHKGLRPRDRQICSVRKGWTSSVGAVCDVSPNESTGKAGNEYNVYMPMNEEYMETGSCNPAFQDLRCRASDATENNDLATAECLIDEVKQIVGPNNETVFKLEGHLKRGWLLYAKNQ